jgi:hypothetical protein
VLAAACHYLYLKNKQPEKNELCDKIPVWYLKRKKEEYIREDTYCHRNCMYKQWCNFIENHLSKVMKKNRIARFFLVVCFLNINSILNKYQVSCN